MHPIFTTSYLHINPAALIVQAGSPHSNNPITLRVCSMAEMILRQIAHFFTPQKISNTKVYTFHGKPMYLKESEVKKINNIHLQVLLLGTGNADPAKLSASSVSPYLHLGLTTSHPAPSSQPLSKHSINSLSSSSRTANLSGICWQKSNPDFSKWKC